uniref:Putative secreted protein n=1 Tax=Lutzomyia longipalpis TaxID=7200 RepID=A0A7G3ALF2_LUTLO
MGAILLFHLILLGGSSGSLRGHPVLLHKPRSSQHTEGIVVEVFGCKRHSTATSTTAGDFTSRKSSSILTNSSQKFPMIPEEDPQKAVKCFRVNRTTSVETTWSFHDINFENFDLSPHKEDLPEFPEAPVSEGVGNGRSDSTV